ncbi:MAG: cob(I)yrinic acid a,c-diamide adenosyltransferase [Anaerolineae bacterium]|nr:cob(I)yrinic acid a,c-diamide adenosyltransferase [Phycisphaerae bacterium]
MKIYTKTGDDGTTGLIGGERISKGDLRIDCYGTVDELNAAVGWAAVVCDGSIGVLLQQIQHELFNIGSHLAVPDKSPEQNDNAPSATPLPPLDEAMIARLEAEIDSAETMLQPLRQFILPGGSEAAARLHLVRTICRRAERLAVELARDHSVPSTIVTYLNRLSDWLFVQARLANQQAGVGDVTWKK